MPHISDDAKSHHCAFTIAEFCEAHRISRSKLYQLVKAGMGPRLMKIGTRRIVSSEAAEAWRRYLETGTENLEAPRPPVLNETET
jgi:hypothetical protein